MSKKSNPKLVIHTYTTEPLRTSMQPLWLYRHPTCGHYIIQYETNSNHKPFPHIKLRKGQRKRIKLIKLELEVKP